MEVLLVSQQHRAVVEDAFVKAKDLTCSPWPVFPPGQHGGKDA